MNFVTYENKLFFPGACGSIRCTALCSKWIPMVTYLSAYKVSNF